MTPGAAKYIAELRDIRELGLFGTADLSWWRRRLAGEHIEPMDVDGHAQVLVTALSSRWMGIPFRDVSVFIAARGAFGCNEAGFLMLSAFNGSRFFAFFERRWFGLPYQFRADLHLDLGGRWAFRLGPPTCAETFAEMGAEDRALAAATLDRVETEVPLFLPSGRDATTARWLRVRVSGETRVVAFDSARDRFEIGENTRAGVFAELHESGFRGDSWHIRMCATHARSKTYRTRVPA